MVKWWCVTPPATVSSLFCQQYWWIDLLIHARMFMRASFHLSSSLSCFYRLCGIDWFFTRSRDWEGRGRRCWASVHYYFSQSVWHKWSLRLCDHKLAADLSWNKKRRTKPIKVEHYTEREPTVISDLLSSSVLVESMTSYEWINADQ